MNTRNEPYSPSQVTQKIHGLRLAAEQLYREEFERIVRDVPPVQLQLFPKNVLPIRGRKT